MKSKATIAAMLMALGLSLGACGGPDGETADDGLASSSAALIGPAASAQVAPVTAPQRAPLVGTNSNPAIQPVGYLIGADSSPDPIPAQPKHAAGPTAAEIRCSLITDLSRRIACFLTLPR